MLPKLNSATYWDVIGGGGETGEILRNLLTQCGKFLQKQGDLSGFQNQVSGQ